MSEHVIGIDFGTDSVRCLVADARTGEEVSQAVFRYPRWSEGLYCDPREGRFRQHPADLVEGLESSVRAALAACPAVTPESVRGLTATTTGSTPVAVDRAGTPLALTPGFEENPNAMFILWKDHTAIEEAERINHVARTWGGDDYTGFSGGSYSAEWFFSKMLHVLRCDERVRAAAFTWLECCDWVPALLTGTADARSILRGRCAAGHKAMWNASHGGLPSEDFLALVDPLLAGARARLYEDTHTSDRSAGTLCPEWAERLGLGTHTVVGVGSIDAHVGAVGGGIAPGALAKVVGTSTCDMMVAPIEQMKGRLVRGICGQVEGSILPGMLGMEAGQSAFGDVYAWFGRFLSWRDDVDTAPLPRGGRDLLDQLMEKAAGRPPGASGVLALDWLNGRRTPDADLELRGALTGLNLGIDAADVMRALVEATCFGARAIADRFSSEGIRIDRVIALGGIPHRSGFVMQTLADVLDTPVRVAASGNTTALGAAMFAATVGGVYPGVPDAQAAMGGGFDETFDPEPGNVAVYSRMYDDYRRLAGFVDRGG